LLYTAPEVVYSHTELAVVANPKPIKE